MQTAARNPAIRLPAPPGKAASPKGGPPGRAKPKVRIGKLEILVMLLAGGALAGLAWQFSFPAAGVLYAVLLIVATMIRPEIAFLLIFLESPLVYDLAADAPVKMAIADVSLVLATPVLLVKWFLSGRSLARNPLRYPVLAYLAVCIVSAAVNGGSGLAVTSMLQMSLYLIWAVFIFANCLDTAEQVFPAFYGLLLTDSVLAVALIFFSSNGYVLGLHKNATGSELDYAVVIATELWLAVAASGKRLWLITAVLLVLMAGLIDSLSRGAWLGTIVGVMVLMMLRGRVKLALRAALALLPVIALCWFLLPEQSRNYAVDFGDKARNVQARYTSLAFAWELFKDCPVLGVGVGLRKSYDATNVVLATMAETGTLGLVSFLSIFAAFGWMVWRTRKTLRETEPAFSLMAIGAALMAAKFVHGCVDHYWSRVMLPVWASAGLAVMAYNIGLSKDGSALSPRRPGRPTRLRRVRSVQ